MEYNAWEAKFLYIKSLSHNRMGTHIFTYIISFTLGIHIQGTVNLSYSGFARTVIRHNSDPKT